VFNFHQTQAEPIDSALNCCSQRAAAPQRLSAAALIKTQCALLIAVQPQQQFNIIQSRHPAQRSLLKTHLCLSVTSPGRLIYRVSQKRDTLSQSINQSINQTTFV